MLGVISLSWMTLGASESSSGGRQSGSMEVVWALRAMKK